MSPKDVKPKPSQGSSGSITLGSVILRIFSLMLFWAGGSWLMLRLWADGYWPFAAVILVITCLITFIWVRPETYPLRWMSPGLVFMLLISVYPILYTVYISFTNFGTGHLIAKTRVIEVLENRKFLPKNGSEYDFALYRNTSGELAVLLLPSPGSEPIVLVPGSTIPQSQTGKIVIEAAPPEQIVIDGAQSPYQLLPKNQILTALSELQGVTFGSDKHAVQVTGMTKAAALESRYVYDSQADTILDIKDNVLYKANDENGIFVSADGRELDPGYTVATGIANYSRFIDNPSFRGPLVMVFLWTVFYALLSTFFPFALGLLTAIVFGRNMPGKGLIKSLLIIPFAIPNVISILVWRGLWNPISGLYGASISAIAGQPVNIFADPILIKAVLIFVETWLSYPYFFLITSGALQAIPTDLYEAAEIDGANAWAQFRHITLPLLLVAVGPLLVGSFMYNFNNFNVVYLFNKGGPPMVGTSTPAGYSDILISYVYRLAFTGTGQDYGYATAITVIIFFVLVVITLFQYRLMNMWEKVGENV